jgi:hypothetical protein
MNNIRPLTELRDAIAAGEAQYQAIAARTYAQRVIAKKAQDADILDRFDRSIPAPRGLPNVPLPPTPLQAVRTHEDEKLRDLEQRLSLAFMHLNTARAALLVAENARIGKRRERLAETILRSNGLDCDEQLAQLVALCPDERVVPLDQRFALSVRVKMALAYAEGTDLDHVNTPVDTLQGIVGTQWVRTRADVLAEADATPPLAAA